MGLCVPERARCPGKINPSSRWSRNGTLLVLHADVRLMMTSSLPGAYNPQTLNAAKQQACVSLVNMTYFNSSIASADVVVLFVGQNVGVTEAEGTDRPIYGMAGQQPTLIRMVAELKKPVVVVLGSSSAVGMDFIKSRSDWSVLLPGLGGIYSTKAIANVLFGDTAPAGLLPYTIYPESWATKGCVGRKGPSCTNAFTDMDLRAGDGRTYKWYGYNNKSLEAAYAFGAGQYYTTFDIKVAVSPSPSPSPSAPPNKHQVARQGSSNSNTGGSGDGALLASYQVTYTNTGFAPSRCRLIMFGRPVAVIDGNAPSPLPVKQILDFGGTPVLAAGESFTESFPVHAGQLSMTDYAGKRATYKGNYEIQFNIGNGTVATEDVTVAFTTVLGQLPAPHA